MRMYVSKQPNMAIKLDLESNTLFKIVYNTGNPRTNEITFIMIATIVTCFHRTLVKHFTNPIFINDPKVMIGILPKPIQIIVTIGIASSSPA